MVTCVANEQKNLAVVAGVNVEKQIPSNASVDLLLILNGTSRCLRNPRLPECLHHAAGTAWRSPAGGGRVCCILKLWFTDTSVSLDGDPFHPSHPQSSASSCCVRLIAFVGPPAPHDSHLERVPVPVKLSAPLHWDLRPFPWTSGILGTWEQAYLAYSMCVMQRYSLQSSLSRSNIDNIILDYLFSHL